MTLPFFQLICKSVDSVGFSCSSVQPLLPRRRGNALTQHYCSAFWISIKVFLELFLKLFLARGLALLFARGLVLRSFFARGLALRSRGGRAQSCEARSSSPDPSFWGTPEQVLWHKWNRPRVPFPGGTRNRPLFRCLTGFDFRGKINF